MTTNEPTDMPPRRADDRYLIVGSRKAKVGQLSAGREQPWAVFMHTYHGSHNGRWSYDGYTQHETEAEALAARDAWLAGSGVN